MAVSIGFYVNHNGGTGVQTALNGSGIGFYGAGGFGTSVSVNAAQDVSYLTNSGGTVNNQQLWNNKWASSTGVYIPGATGIINVNNMPNFSTVLNIRASSDGDPVRVQNVYFRAYDRNSINSGPSGVTLKAYETRHTSTSQSDAGSVNASWSTPAGSAVTLQLSNSPGISGLQASGGNLAAPASALPSATRHDWYLMLSAIPDSIGAKLFAGYVSLEYL